MDQLLHVPKSMPRQERHEAAIDQIMDVPGLSKLRKIMEDFNISYVTFDYRLQITVKSSKDHCPKKAELIKKNLDK